MKTVYLFDVDNTLTPSRGLMDPRFQEWFIRFQETHETYLVTGSDRPKTLEQVGQAVVDSCKLLFSCCGNEVWDGDTIIHRSDWEGTPELFEELENQLEIASFRLRTGNHIEKRTGLINFSIIGRGADQEQRAQYVAYDRTRFERRSLVTRLSERFHELEFAIAGETGIDIYPIGSNKSQVLRWITADRMIFFGDAIWPGGNDYPLALKCTQSYCVADWRDTWQLLGEKHQKDI